MKKQAGYRMKDSEISAHRLAMALAGRRIVVTRAAHQATGLARQLAEVGATPLVMPAIRIAPVADLGPFDEAIRHLEAYHWVIFSSVNGVEIFCRRLAGLGYGQAALDQTKVAAVGPATAAALDERGIRVDLVPEEFVAEALIASLGELRGCRILLPRAAAGRREVADQLAQQGALVDDMAVYETLPGRLDENALAELQKGVDAVTFTSGLTVRYFVGMAGAELLARSVVACIGPVTAATACELGLPVAIVAPEYTSGGLVAALARYFAREHE
jgi:uroporphyrinogen III methyltransferase / synthase